MHQGAPVEVEEQRPRSSKEVGSHHLTSGGDERQELYRLDPLLSKVKKVYEALFIICNVDFFLVIRNKIESQGKNKCCKLHVPAEARGSRRGTGDEQRAQIDRLRRGLVFYLVLRFTIRGLIGFAQLTWIRLKRNNFHPLNRGGLSSASNAPGASCPLLEASRIFMPTFYQTALDYGLASSDPYRSTYRSISTDLIAGSVLLPLGLIFLFLILPLCGSIRPLDAANLRFMIEPAKEARRLDLVIVQHLEKLLEECPRNGIVLEQLKQVSSLRFDTFSPRWRKTLFRYTMIELSLSYSSSTLIITAVIYAYFSRFGNILCADSQPEACDFSNVFSKQDYLYIVELLGIILLLIVGGCVWFSLVVINGICQVSLVRSIEKELRHCLAVISLSNLNDRVVFRYAQSLDNQDLVGDTVSILKNEDTREQKYIESSLLRAYIKLIISLEEAKKHSRLTGRALEAHIIALSVPGLLAFSMRNFSNDAETQLVQIAMLFITWVFVNPGLVFCAYIHSRTVERERIAWSILAQLSIYKERNSRKGDLESFSSERHIRMLANRWRKLVMGYALSESSGAVRAFGTRLTYSRVLSMNYALISVVLLLKLS